WRPARIGLAVLVLVQLVGLNLWAGHQRAEVREKKAQMVSLLQTSFPQVTGVLDAPVQMRREVQTLRALAGIPGPADLEPLLFAAAAAWPAGKPPADTLRYEPGRLSLPAADWRPDEIERFNAQLQASGYSAVVADGRLQLGPTPGRGL
ncbi:MAG: GspL/Epsl periplasmic domain-containing protein, partial [Ideonella sp.]